MKVNTTPDLSVAARLRLSQALRESVKDDKVLSAAELVAKVGPLLDEFHISAEDGAAQIKAIMQQFGDGSVIDPEASKVLAGASARFELGNDAAATRSRDPVRELSRLIDGVRGVAQNPIGTRSVAEQKVVLKRQLLSAISEITSRPELVAHLKQNGRPGVWASVAVDLPPGLEPTLFRSSMYTEPRRATQASLRFDPDFPGKVRLQLEVPYKGEFHGYEADFAPVPAGLEKLIERSPVEAGAAFAENLLRALRANIEPV